MDRRSFLKSPTLLLVPAPTVATEYLAGHSTYKSLKELFSALKGCVLDHPGCRVLSSDDPEHRRVGFCVEAGADQYLFDIGLTSLRASFADFEEVQKQALETAFKSVAGRRVLAQTFENVPPWVRPNG